MGKLTKKKIIRKINEALKMEQNKSTHSVKQKKNKDQRYKIKKRKNGTKQAWLTTSVYLEGGRKKG